MRGVPGGDGTLVMFFDTTIDRAVGSMLDVEEDGWDHRGKVDLVKFSEEVRLPNIFETIL